MQRTFQTVFTVQGSLETPTIQINDKRKKGRPGFFLTALELKEAIKYYLTTNEKEKQPLLNKYGTKKLRHAKAICSLDMGTRGAVFRHICAFHGRDYLVYSWTGAEDGVRIRCFAPSGCTLNTHHSGYLFAPSPVVGLDPCGTE